MKHRIRFRIFIPVLIIIFLLAAAAGIIFSATADWYAGYMAQRSLTGLMQMIEREAETIYGSQMQEEGQSREEQRQDSKGLLEQIKLNMKARGYGAKLMVFNSKKNQVYPQEGTEEPVNQIIARKLTQILEEECPDGGMPARKIEIGSESWLVEIFEVPASYNVRARYFAGYIPIPDMGLLLAYAGRLLDGIVFICFIIGGIAVWIIARSIAKPIESMCIQADKIGRGSYVPICEEYSLLELEQLKDSFNRMEERLKQAEERNRCFFQNISHDLRTPLAAITGYAQGIQHGIMDEPGKAAGIILSESLRMTELVESILTISKMDSHELQLNMIRIDLEEFLDEQVEVFKGIPDEKKLKFTGDAEGIYVKVDPQLMVRIIQNVISNCIRYAKSTVTVDIESEQGWGIVTIKDDGPGFSCDALSHAFERFYYGENGKFGIGLSIVYSGMEYMGGRVEIGNRKLPCHGAVYRLSFRLDD